MHWLSHHLVVCYTAIALLLSLPSESGTVSPIELVIPSISPLAVTLSRLRCVPALLRRSRWGLGSFSGSCYRQGLTVCFVGVLQRATICSCLIGFLCHLYHWTGVRANICRVPVLRDVLASDGTSLKLRVSRSCCGLLRVSDQCSEEGRPIGSAS